VTRVQAGEDTLTGPPFASVSPLVVGTKLRMFWFISPPLYQHNPLLASRSLPPPSYNGSTRQTKRLSGQPGPYGPGSPRRSFPPASSRHLITLGPTRSRLAERISTSRLVDFSPFDTPRSLRNCTRSHHNSSPAHGRLGFFAALWRLRMDPHDLRSEGNPGYSSMLVFSPCPQVNSAGQL